MKTSVLASMALMLEPFTSLGVPEKLAVDMLSNMTMML